MKLKVGRLSLWLFGVVANKYHDAERIKEDFTSALASGESMIATKKKFENLITIRNRILDPLSFPWKFFETEDGVSGGNLTKTALEVRTAHKEALSRILNGFSEEEYTDLLTRIKKVSITTWLYQLQILPGVIFNDVYYQSIFCVEVLYFLGGGLTGFVYNELI